MRRSVVLGFAAMLVVAGAIPGAAAPPASPDATPAPVASPPVELRLPDASVIFDSTEPPITVTPTEDAGPTRVWAEVPPAGASITATGSDGTVYRLDIPADALAAPTSIGMVPLTAVDGIPFGEGVVHAVELLPSGLAFLKPATLTITPVDPLPLADRIPIAAQGPDHDLTIAEPAPDPATIGLVVEHFSLYGVDKGLLADTEPVRRRLGGDAEQRLASEWNAAFASAQQAGLTQEATQQALGAEMQRILDQYYTQVVAPRIAAAAQSCANARLAVETAIGYSRKAQLLGLADPTDYAPLVDTAGHVCLKEEMELCTQQHIFWRIAGVAIGILRQEELLGSGDSALAQEAQDDVARCLTFRLEFDSKVTAKGDQGGRFVPSVHAEVTLTGGLDTNVITGTAPLEMPTFTAAFPRCHTTPVPDSSQTFSVTSLTWDDAPGLTTDDPGGILDLTLEYDPGKPQEHVRLACPGGFSTDLKSPFWHAAYVLAHRDEWGGGAAVTGSALAQKLPLGGGAGADPFSGINPLEVPKDFPGLFKATGWDVTTGTATIATKDWSKKVPPYVTEKGTFTLIHAPR